ncbi:MAG: CBS domain-containing protein [Thermodesulfobacteriota bacterium]|nr:CBS domain-containing protein [Thermodesulfobacteriota bacterium]
MNPDQMLSYEFIRSHPTDAARVLERLTIEETRFFLEDTPLHELIGVMSVMDPIVGARCLERMEERRSARLIEKLPLETGTLLLRRMEKSIRGRILGSVSYKLKTELQRMLRYREGTAGNIMDAQVFTVPDDITVKDALNKLREHSGKVLEYVYVLGRENALIGFFPLHQLTTSQHQCVTSSITRKIPWKLNPNMSRKAILTNPGWQTFNALPVVDENGVFLGAIGHISLRQLDNDVLMPPFSKEAAVAGSALAELYWISISAFTKGIAIAATPQRHTSMNFKRRELK